jgi:hypothetical protein
LDRALNPNEAAVIGWLLEHAAVRDATAYRQHPVEDLRVVGACDCGCASLDFQPKGPGAKIIADALAVYPDGQEAGLILWGRDGAIQSLEVFDHHPNASHRVPEVPNLRTYEERGRELL